MDKETLAKQSPLSLLGLPDNGTDLLDEVMKGKVEPPGSGFSRGFGGAKETAFDTFQKAAPIGSPEAVEPTIPEKTQDEPQGGEQDEEPVEQADNLDEDPDKSAGGDDTTLPPYFHSLNEQHEEIRQRTTAVEQALKEAQRREQLYQEYIRNTNQRVQQNHQQQPAQPAQDDYTWAQQGFESQEHYKLFQDSVSKVADERARSLINQTMLPMLNQSATDRFGAAVDRCAKEYPHFEKYFPRDALQNYFTHIVQNYGLQTAAQMNYEQEFRAAYKVRDYDRVIAEQTSNEQKNKANGQTQKDAKQERKAQLKLVPKANQAGAPATKKTLDDEFNEMGKVGVRDVGRILRQRLLAQ